MPETKLALMERLRKERRWDEADRFREETRERLKREGLPRREAREEAWRLTAEKFPAVVKAKANVTVTNGQRIEAVKESVVIDHTDDERRQLVQLVERPGAWRTNLTDAIERIFIQARNEDEFSPTEAGSVLEWLLWKLWHESNELFVLFFQSEYLLRHGESLRSIAWPTATEFTLRLRYQFTSDLNTLGRDDAPDPSAAPTNGADTIGDESLAER